MKKLLTFSALVWLIVIAVAFCALGWPLLENAWAGYRWISVPCGLQGHRYFYEYKGINYIASRRDFWDRSPNTRRATINNVAGDTGPRIAFNDHCFISPADPTNAVLRLDALDHPEEAVPGFMISFLALAAGVVLTFAARKKRRQGR